tara:strand:- start:294 stop:722 length:429 start_codon:yes stop_codon:yes gene_type:complete
MNTYIGRKTIMAKPMTLGEYNTYRGWGIPEDEDPSTEGYLVEYTDGGKANHPDHEGYISWSPADVFARSYMPADTHTDRMKIEYSELEANLGKLQGFMNGKAYADLNQEQKLLMQQQEQLMVLFMDTLRKRIAADEAAAKEA